MQPLQPWLLTIFNICLWTTLYFSFFSLCTLQYIFRVFALLFCPLQVRARAPAKLHSGEKSKNLIWHLSTQKIGQQGSLFEVNLVHTGGFLRPIRPFWHNLQGFASSSVLRLVYNGKCKISRATHIPSLGFIPALFCNKATILWFSFSRKLLTV